MYYSEKQAVRRLCQSLPSGFAQFKADGEITLVANTPVEHIVAKVFPKVVILDFGRDQIDEQKDAFWIRFYPEAC